MVWQVVCRPSGGTTVRVMRAVVAKDEGGLGAGASGSATIVWCPHSPTT